MDILEAIKTRRSIRTYTGEALKDEEIKTLLEAGFLAPTGHNHQPVEFIVIDEKDTIRELVGVHKYAKMIEEAGFGILVCANGERESSRGFLIEDGAAALQNILLAAHGMGLGGVWVSVHGNDEVEEEVRNLFKLPDNVMAIGIAVVGNTNKKGHEVDRYRKDRIHNNSWGRGI